MSEWEECYLSDVGTLARGKSKHRPRWAEHLYGGSYPFIQTGEISAANKYINTYQQMYSEAGLAQSKLWDKGTLCITIAANIAEIAILDFPACFPDSVLGFIPDPEKADLDFVFYTLTFLKERIQNLAIGSVQENINLGTFQNIKFLFPPIDEQKQIAAVLSCLDRKTENLRKQNETLEAIAQTLFKHWFVDFEFPNEYGKPYKSSGGAMVRSELGGIPVGWHVGKLGDVADVKSSKRIFLSEYVESGIPFYRSKEIIELSSGQEISTSLYISEERFREVESKFGTPEAGEILVTSVGTIGVTYIVTSRDQFYFKDGNLTWIKNFRGGFNGVVIYYWLKSDSARNQIEQNTIGSTQKALTIQALSGLKLILPNSNVLSKYRDFVESIHSKRESNTQQIKTLTKTRDVLLPKLMSGKLRIVE